MHEKNLFELLLEKSILTIFDGNTEFREIESDGLKRHLTSKPNAVVPFLGLWYRSFLISGLKFDQLKRLLGMGTVG